MEFMAAMQPIASPSSRLDRFMRLFLSKRYLRRNGDEGRGDRRDGETRGTRRRKGRGDTKTIAPKVCRSSPPSPPLPVIPSPCHPLTLTPYCFKAIICMD
jgi:hypothetical protein